MTDLPKDPSDPGPAQPSAAGDGAAPAKPPGAEGAPPAPSWGTASAGSPTQPVTGWGGAQPGGWGPVAPGVVGYPTMPATTGWPLASWGQRALATIIDALLTVPFALLATVVFVVWVVSVDPDTGETSGGGGLALALGVLLSLAAFAVAVWNMVFRQGRSGQSVGKSVIGIRVAKESDGAPQGALMSVVRWILHSSIDAALCYLGYLWPLWDVKRQTFTDKILSTVVVDVKAGAPAA